MPPVLSLLAIWTGTQIQVPRNDILLLWGQFLSDRKKGIDLTPSFLCGDWVDLDVTAPTRRLKIANRRVVGGVIPIIPVVIELGLPRS
jgi:hypothetical protein